MFLIVVKSYEATNYDVHNSINIDKAMKILKFGGKSLANGTRFGKRGGDPLLLK